MTTLKTQELVNCIFRIWTIMFLHIFSFILPHSPWSTIHLYILVFFSSFPLVCNISCEFQISSLSSLATRELSISFLILNRIYILFPVSLKPRCTDTPSKLFSVFIYRRTFLFLQVASSAVRKLFAHSYPYSRIEHSCSANCPLFLNKLSSF